MDKKKRPMMPPPPPGMPTPPPVAEMKTPKGTAMRMHWRDRANRKQGFRRAA